MINIFIFVSWELIRFFTVFKYFQTLSPLRLNYDYTTKEDKMRGHVAHMQIKKGIKFVAEIHADR